MSKYGIQTKGTSPILLDKGPHGHASQPNLSTYDKGGRVGLKKGGDTRVKKFGGGRTNLLEELGRVEAEPSNRNRRAEIGRVHGELNRGYKKGGRVAAKQGYFAKEDESIGMRLGKGKAGTKERDLSYGKWGHRGRDWKKSGGRVGLKKGSDKNWIQDVNKSIKARGTKGKCTPITKPGCTGKAKALAKTFKKMAKKRKS
jgi:hypothetical protein